MIAGGAVLIGFALGLVLGFGLALTWRVFR